MAWTKVQYNANPAALTVGNETTLESTAITAAATYVLEVDLSNLAAGDVIEIRIKKVGPTGSGLLGAYFATYANAQGADEALKLSVPVPVDDVGNRISFTLKQTAGTGRVIPWLVKAV